MGEQGANILMAYILLCCTFNRIDNWTFALRMLSIFPSHRRQKMEMEKKHLFSCLAHRLCDVTQSTDECIRTYGMVMHIANTLRITDYNYAYAHSAHSNLDMYDMMHRIQYLKIYVMMCVELWKANSFL